MTEYGVVSWSDVNSLPKLTCPGGGRLTDVCGKTSERALWRQVGNKPHAGTTRVDLLRWDDRALQCPKCMQEFGPSDRWRWRRLYNASVGRKVAVLELRVDA